MKADFLKSDTYKFIYSYMKYPNALILRTCLETGLRVGDVVSLPSEALQGNKIHYTAQKTGKSGVAQISTDLANRIRNDKGKWLFPSPHNLAKHRTRQAVWRDMSKACKLLGIEQHITPHSARKTFAVELYKKDGLNAVQKALQHDNLNTTMIYAFSDILGQNSQKNVENYVKNIDFEAFAELVAQKVYEKIKGMT